MYLIDPATGKQSKEYLTVLGFDSDAFQTALVEKRRANAKVLTLSEDLRDAAADDAELDLIAATVTGWSMDEDFTREGLLELLREAPSVRLEIDKFAANRANFINPR